MDVERLLRRVRQRDAKAIPQENPVREKPPEPLRCERCRGVVTADEVECMYGDYWLCRDCLKLHAVALRVSIPQLLSRFGGKAGE